MNRVIGIVLFLNCKIHKAIDSCLGELIGLKTRNYGIDLLKAVAIFFVVSYHSTIYSYDILSDFSLIHCFRYFFRTILSTCVPLFFFINGYLLFGKPLNLKKHILKTMHYVWLAFFWSAVVLTASILIFGHHLSFHNILSAYLKMENTYGGNVFWYLGALVVLYILFPSLKVLYDTNHTAFLYTTAVCAAVTFGYGLITDILTFTDFVIHHFAGVHLPIVSLNHKIFTMFIPLSQSRAYSIVYFCLGGLALRYEQKILEKSVQKHRVLFVFGILICCVMLFLEGVFYTRYINKAVWDVVWNGYDTVFTLFSVLFMYLLSLNVNFERPVIRIISENTMSIYLIHMIFVKLMDATLEQISFMKTLPINVLCSFAVIWVCIWIGKIIKKIPLLKKII